MASDQELKDAYNGYKDKKEKYERVRNSITSHRLDYTRSTKDMDDFISYCEGIIAIVEGEPGYHYLNNFATKLQDDVDKMTKYRDYVRDANTSFKKLHDKLEKAIKSIDQKMATIRDEYNEGKLAPWDRLW